MKSVVPSDEDPNPSWMWPNIWAWAAIDGRIDGWGEERRDKYGGVSIFYRTAPGGEWRRTKRVA